MCADDLPNICLETKSSLFKAVLELIQRTEAGIDFRNSTITIILTGGVAVSLYCASRLSKDVDAIFSQHIILPDTLIRYTGPNNKPQTLSWGTNYSATIGLLHPDYEKDAIALNQNTGNFKLKVLSPVDLAVSKLGRYADNDQRDIHELYISGYLVPADLELRFSEAIPYYTGNLAQIYHNLRLALEGMDYNITITPDTELPFKLPVIHTEAHFLKVNTSTDIPKHCLNNGGMNGMLVSLSADNSVAFVAKDNQIFAVYRDDCMPMPDLLNLKGTFVNMLAQVAKTPKIQ